MFGPSNGCCACCAFGFPRNAFVGAALGLTFFALGNYPREVAAHGPAAGDERIILFQESLSPEVSKHETLITRIADEIKKELLQQVPAFINLRRQRYSELLDYAKSKIDFHHAVVMQFEDAGDAGISLTISLKNVSRDPGVAPVFLSLEPSMPFGFESALSAPRLRKLAIKLGQVVKPTIRYYFALQGSAETLVADCILPDDEENAVDQNVSKDLTISYGGRLRRSSMGRKYEIKAISRREVVYMCSTLGAHPGRGGFFRHSISGVLLRDRRELELYWESGAAFSEPKIVTFDHPVNDDTVETAVEKVVKMVTEMDAARQKPE